MSYRDRPFYCGKPPNSRVAEELRIGWLETMRVYHDWRFLNWTGKIPRADLYKVAALISTPKQELLPCAG